MDLVLVACLVTAPADCRDERLAMSEQRLPAMVCDHAAIAAIAEWAAGHPERQAVRWRCEPRTR